MRRESNSFQRDGVIHKYYFSKNSILVIFYFLFLSSPWIYAQSSLSLEKRIEGFQQHQKEQQSFTHEREKLRDEYLKEQAAQKKEKERAYNEYLKSLAKKQKKVDPESTPAYEEYLLEKWRWKNNPEKKTSQEALVKQKKKIRSSEKSKKFEMDEYSLNSSEENRVPYNKRRSFHGDNAKPGGFTGATPSGADSGGRAPYVPPPPPPPSFDNDLPEFEENNDIPPPPPPDFGPGGMGEPFGGEPAPFMPPPPPPPPLNNEF